MILRRRGLSREGFARALENAQAMAVELDMPGLKVAFTATARLACQHGLTLYDAAYLELALRRRLPLASLDKQFCAAATAEGVPLLP